MLYTYTFTHIMYTYTDEVVFCMFFFSRLQLLLGTLTFMFRPSLCMLYVCLCVCVSSQMFLFSFHQNHMFTIFCTRITVNITIQLTYICSGSSGCRIVYSFLCVFFFCIFAKYRVTMMQTLLLYLSANQMDVQCFRSDIKHALMIGWLKNKSLFGVNGLWGAVKTDNGRQCRLTFFLNSNTRCVGKLCGQRCRGN